MSDSRSVYEVECLCGEKVRTLTNTVKCGKCGRTIVLESWQVNRTMTPRGVVREKGGIQ
jgi:hypothetical protein